MKKSFKVTGMHCKSCEILIKEALEDIPEIKSAQASHKDNIVIIETKDKIDDIKVIKAIELEGYKVKR